MEVREEHQDNPRGTRDVLTSQTVTYILGSGQAEESSAAVIGLLYIVLNILFDSPEVPAPIVPWITHSRLSSLLGLACFHLYILTPHRST
jgi:hypothetical protein